MREGKLAPKTLAPQKHLRRPRGGAPPVRTGEQAWRSLDLSAATLWSAEFRKTNGLNLPKFREVIPAFANEPPRHGRRLARVVSGASLRSLQLCRRRHFQGQSRQPLP